MAKRKKYPKLPNGYGSIRYLGPGRRNPYAVRPPVEGYDDDGRAIMPPVLCYVQDWTIGFMVLTAWHAGTYTPGMELTVQPDRTEINSAGPLIQRILADYNISRSVHDKLGNRKTFAQMYEEFYAWKYGKTQKQLSEASQYSTRAAYKNCSALHNKVFADLRYQDLQRVIDDCQLKHASKVLIVSLIHQIYKYADMTEQVEKDYSAHVTVSTPNDDEHGVAFTEEELKKLWNMKEDPIAELILIMCYSGYRIAAYTTLTVNMEEWYFRGGVKTASGKNRIVPIHSAIRDMVQDRIKRYGGHLLDMSAARFRSRMYACLAGLGIERHTPHDCRHTFSALCEKYGVAENDRKRMLGHSFGADITNGIYGHRSLEDLRAEIEKIKTPL